MCKRDTGMARVFCRGLGEIKALRSCALDVHGQFFIIKTYDVRSGET